MGISQYGADHRAATLLAQQGADAVAGETDRAANQTLRSEYAAALLRGGLDPVDDEPGAGRVATLEDYAEVPDLLLRAADGVPADPRVHAAYLRAAGRIDAEADLRRVLTALAGPESCGRRGGWRCSATRGASAAARSWRCC